MSCSGTCHTHINFTSRGKLLLIDVEKAKRDEFNRRRKIRLQQVRQQSSEIAKEIRDKVKAEKILKHSQEELRKQAQFDRWKEVQYRNLQDELNRKAVIAEQEKENALKDAELVELEKERHKVLDEIAKKRGNLAVLKQRKEKLSVETECFLKLSNAKFNRSLENLRSALVSSLPKPDAKKTPTDPMTFTDRRQINDGIAQNSSTVFTTENAKDLLDDESVLEIIGSSERATAPTHSSRTEIRPDYNAMPSSIPDSAESYPSRQFPREEVHLDKFNIDSDSRPQFYPIRRSQLPQYPSTRSTSPGTMKKAHCTRSQESPNKRSASGTLMSPSKRSIRSNRCNHSNDTSPVRCSEYSPNSYLEEDSIDTDLLRPRRVRFEKTPIRDACGQILHSHRNRAFSEGESDVSFKSDITWPPMNWNNRQEEDVILYDHCGRTTSRYQPTHSVSIIHDQTGDDGIEEEIKASRERALRKHEEALRERRGCRALYRQRLKAEFSCMMSDLANIDKQVKLAKLETDAKAALFPRKQRNSKTCDNNEDTMGDTPGRVQVLDCFDRVENMDVVFDKKMGPQVAREELTDCNLDALDQLLTRLKTQRDHLLECQACEENGAQVDKEVHSISVQCTREKTDIATSPRETTPVKNVERSFSEDIKQTSPRRKMVDTSSSDHNGESLDTSNINHKEPNSGLEVLSSQASSPLNEKASFPAGPRKSSELSTKHTKEKNISEKLIVSKNCSNMLQTGSPINISNGTNSSVSVDSTSYSFEGVKVEVKVTKNKTKRVEKMVGIKTSSRGRISEQSLDNSVMTQDNTEATGTTKHYSWSKKLEENNSSGGTSYMSPPDNLNPDEHKLLISVLEGMEKKNSNPVLRMYIHKLLEMSKGSLENMSISVSDESVKSEIYKSCEDSMGESAKHGYSNQRIMTKDNERKELQYPSSITEMAKDPVRIVMESDDGSTINRDSSFTSNHEQVCSQDHPTTTKSSNSEYMNALSQYNKRLQTLADMMARNLQTTRKCYSVNDTSYFQIPSDLEGSVKLTESAQEFGLPYPESSTEDISQGGQTGGVGASTPFGVSLNILPKPDSLNYTPQDRRLKPPSTINNHNTRRVLPEFVAPHELSTIAEIDSKLGSFYPTNKACQTETLDQVPIDTKTAGMILTERKSEDDSFHTMPPISLPACTDSSFISSGTISPVKPANESSLQILHDMTDSSFGQSSAEEKAVSEVFRSLGIGWALSTWRKTHEASQRYQEPCSSTSSSDAAILNKKRRDDYIKYRHSTPIKFSNIGPQKTTKILSNEDDVLTPPSVTLYQRYQNLIHTSSDASCSQNS